MTLHTYYFIITLDGNAHELLKLSYHQCVAYCTVLVQRNNTEKRMLKLKGVSHIQVIHYVSP